MDERFRPQYITDEQGTRVSVVLSIQQWQQLVDDLEELDDSRLYNDVKAQSASMISLAEYRQKRQRTNG